jgi:PIN domain nuclease of toxin-antitoxin system
MKVLLDSHTFLWLAESPAHLSPEAHEICRSAQNTILLSLVSLWELQIKTQLGKLRLSMPLQITLHEQQRVNNIQLLAISPAHIFALESLPNYHRDPFDRLLIAQSLAEGLPILSRDSVLAQYPAHVIW